MSWFADDSATRDPYGDLNAADYWLADRGSHSRERQGARTMPLQAPDNRRAQTMPAEPQRKTHDGVRYVVGRRSRRMRIDISELEKNMADERKLTRYESSVRGGTKKEQRDAWRALAADSDEASTWKARPVKLGTSANVQYATASVRSERPPHHTHMR